VLEAALSPYRGKGTGEPLLLRQVWGHLETGDETLQLGDPRLGNGVGGWTLEDQRQMIEDGLLPQGDQLRLESVLATDFGLGLHTGEDG